MATSPFPLSDISSLFTETTLLDILRQGLARPDAALDRWEVTGNQTKGDSYLSTIIRLRAYAKPSASGDDSSSDHLDLFIKCLPANIGRRKTFRSTDFFRNEVAFYNVVVPALEVFQKKRCPRVPFVEIPRCYAALSDGEHDYVILRDATADGFATTVRQDGLDYEHCKMVLDKLGRFHGVSMALRVLEPELFNTLADSLEETYIAERFRAWYYDFGNLLKIIARDAISKEYPGTIYESKFLHFINEDFYDRMIEHRHNRGSNAVFCQGDTWVPNFLMKYQNGAVASTMLIDFQLAKAASPALDLSFMIYSCTTKKLRDEKYDELLKVYYDGVCSMLTDLGCKSEEVFPYSALLGELRLHGSFGIGFCMEAVPFSIMDNSDAFDLDTIKGDEAINLTAIWDVKPIKTQEGRRRLADCIVHAVDRGYIV